MALRGTIRNGKVELEGGADLPDGTKVKVEITRKAAPRPRLRTPRGTAPSLYRLAELAVTDPSLPTDLAAEHDHYIYGTPKRGRRKRGNTAAARGQRSRVAATVQPRTPAKRAPRRTRRT